jgi:hypothetical protein
VLLLDVMLALLLANGLVGVMEHLLERVLALLLDY